MTEFCGVAVRIGEGQDTKDAEVRHLTVARAAFNETRAQALKGLGAGDVQREMIDATAREHRLRRGRWDRRQLERMECGTASNVD